MHITHGSYEINFTDKNKNNCQVTFSLVQMSQYLGMYNTDIE